MRELPPGNTKEAAYFANALSEAGARYDRYTARRKDWIRYGPRRRRLQSVAKLANDLASVLYQLDILSSDDLATRIDPKKIETLVGSLLFLSKESQDLATEVQDKGKPRDLAEERWIFELADIYKNAFGQTANVSGSGSDSDDDELPNRRGKFYRLLEVSRPASFPRHGKLSLRQIDRMLERRKEPNDGFPGLTAERSDGTEPEKPI